jgi:long-chain acyl-CoA synthetase
MTQAAPTWPAATIEETRAILSAPGMPFEMETAEVRGISTRVYAQAVPHLRAIFDMTTQWGEREFLVYENDRLTYGAFHRAASALGKLLVERFGVAKGDRVAVIMRNYPEWPLAFWAAAAIGAVVVPINAWGTGPDLEYALADSGARVAVVDGERLERLIPHLGNLDLAAVVAVRTPRHLLGPALALDDLIGPLASWASLPEGNLPDPNLHPDDDATILYTSGTTGKPKGALGTHRNVMSNLISITFGAMRALVRRGEALPVADPTAPQRTNLLPVPFFHVTGCHSMMIPTMATGTRLILMHKWNAEHALELVERERINGFVGVPSMVWQIIESPDFATRDISSLDAISYGGAAAAPELTRKVRELFPTVWPGQGYGLTETSSVSTANSAEDYLARPESVGIAVPVCDLRVVDADGRDVATGEIGELLIKGPNVIKAYWNKPEATAKAIVDGWFHSGDIVRMDADGFVYLLDRAKDMVIRGGENIYSVEIEDVLFAHPAVVDAAIVGIPHRVLGEEVGAVVQVKPGASVSEAELRSHVAQRLASFKVPVRIDIRTVELPKNANGKTLKNILREEIQALAPANGG